MGRASLVMHNKVLLKNGVIVEMKIWNIADDNRYPDGYKYSLLASYSH